MTTNPFNKWDNLRQMHDELKVQTHLFKAEVRDEWNNLEKNWNQLQREMQPVVNAAESSRKNISQATSLLMDEVKNGYQNIRRAIK